jgi:hypothetical protein
MYKIPKDKALVLIKVPPLPPEWKTVFISSCAETHQGGETVSDLFNMERPFLPLLDEQGGIVLVRRGGIRWLRIEDPEKKEWYYYEIRQGAPQMVARFQFPDGEVVEGTVYAIGPAGEQRVQDIVNRDEMFLPVDTANGLFLINKTLVSSIKVMENPNAGS